MNELPPTPGHEPHTPVLPTPPTNLQFRAAMLLLLMLLLVIGAIVYVMYARGVFEVKQQLVLVADDSEGVVVGMDLTFSGFPIGRVSRIELGKEGNARMIVDVPTKDAHWLRKTSVFVLERGLVGNTRMRAFSGILTDPPLEDGATRKLLVGDASAEVPRLVATAKELIENLKALTASDSSLDASLGNVKTLTAKLNGKNGMLDGLLGDEKNVQKLLTALDRTNALLARVDGLTGKADGLVANANTQVFGPNGVMKDAQATVVQLNAMLADTRESLKKVDKVLIEAQAVAANVKVGTTDLGTLRNDVDASLRKVDSLVNEINRKWPFKRDAEIKLP